MRFGITILPEMPWAQAAPLWREADAMGFDHGWTYDHLTWSGLPDAPWYGTMPTLMGAALVTHRMRLGTFVASPNFRHPAAFVREIASVQDASQGRLILGLGKGGDRDAGVLGGPELSLRRRMDRYEEFLELLGRLLREDHVDHHGDYYECRDARTLPLLDPLPQLVLAANGPRALRLAAAHGQGWVTTGPGDAEDAEDWWRKLAGIVERADAVLPEGTDRFLNLDSGPQYSLESAALFEDAVGRAGALGFTDVIAHWPRAEGPYAGSVEVLEDAVARVVRG